MQDNQANAPRFSSLKEGNDVEENSEVLYPLFEEDQTEQNFDEQAIQNPISLNFSQSILGRLQFKAHAEGVSVEELACELVAEGLVLRAWEIMERKATMKGNHPLQSKMQNNQQNFSKSNNFANSTTGNQRHSSSQPQPQRSQHSSQSSSGGSTGGGRYFANKNNNTGHARPGPQNRSKHIPNKNNFQKNRRNHEQVQNMMEDQASFIEYVRSQK